MSIGLEENIFRDTLVTHADHFRVYIQMSSIFQEACEFGQA